MDQRLNRFIDSLQEVEGALVENPTDLLYLTGLPLSRGQLWVTPNDISLLVDGRYLETAKKTFPHSVFSIDHKLSLPKRIAFDSETTSYASFLMLQKKWSQVDWVPVPRLLKRLRSIKEPSEIASLQRACRLTLSGIEHVKQLYTEGVTEKELAFQFEFFCRKQGASGLSFDSIIAFGEKSAYPHYRAGSQKLQKNQNVLIDVGAVVDGYHGDLTRSDFFGEPNVQLLDFKVLVEKAFEAAYRLARPGAKASDLDRAARDVFKEKGLEKLFVHSLGHGVGLETHEYPALRADSPDLLEEGQVITIEPGLYQPGLGGIRFEEMVLITQQGAKLLHV